MAVKNAIIHIILWQTMQYQGSIKINGLTSFTVLQITISDYRTVLFLLITVYVIIQYTQMTFIYRYYAHTKTHKTHKYIYLWKHIKVLFNHNKLASLINERAADTHCWFYLGFSRLDAWQIGCWCNLGSKSMHKKNVLRIITNFFHIFFIFLKIPIKLKKSDIKGNILCFLK